MGSMQGSRIPDRARNRNVSRRNALRTLRRRDTVGLLLLGKCESGKTSLVKRWVNGTFNGEYEATIEDFYTKTYRHMGQCVNVGIIDLSGSWDFPAMMDLYLSRVDSVMLVYDTGNLSSISNLTHLYNRLLKVRGENNEVLVSIVGTKVDVTDDRLIEENSVALNEFLKTMNNSWKQITTSAKLNLNINEAFENALNEVVAYMMPNEDTIKRLDKLMKKSEKKEGCLNCCPVQ